MSKTFNIALALRDAHFIGREFFLGAYSFANTRPDWRIQRSDDTTFLNWEQAIRLRPDGIIGVLDREHPIDPSQISTSRVVIVNNSVRSHPYHRVISDSFESGRRVAAYLIERRLRSFAYVGIAQVYFSELRRNGFIEVLRKAGISGDIPTIYYEANYAPPKHLQSWLRSLPLPCGVLCTNDGIGERIIRESRLVGLNVPNDLAVASISNDTISCLESEVTLSSLNQNFHQVGRRAAMHLHAWLKGTKNLDQCECVPPGEMIERDSTRTNGASDPLVRRALAIIQREFREELSVDALLVRLGNVSRRQLENRFRDTINSSPHEEILKHRLRESQRLIRSTHLSFKEIAYETGFYDPAHFCRQFKRVFGTTPSKYRRSYTSKN